MNIQNINAFVSARAVLDGSHAGELSDLLGLCKTLHGMADNAPGMTQGTLECLIDAQAHLRRIIIETPAASCADVAAKFGLVAHLAGNDQDLYRDEPDALQAALNSLAFRDRHFDLAAAA